MNFKFTLFSAAVFTAMVSAQGQLPTSMMPMGYDSYPQSQSQYPSYPQQGNGPRRHHGRLFRAINYLKQQGVTMTPQLFQYLKQGLKQGQDLNSLLQTIVSQYGSQNQNNNVNWQNPTQYNNGFNGYNGYNGYNGFNGYNGYNGYSGYNGYNGYTGNNGYGQFQGQAF